MKTDRATKENKGNQAPNGAKKSHGRAEKGGQAAKNNQPLRREHGREGPYQANSEAARGEGVNAPWR